MNLFHRALTAGTLVITLSALAVPLFAQSAAPQAQAQAADVLFYNGNVITEDDYNHIVSAVVVKDGRILAVGGNELRSQYNATREIDLHGRTLMPGFDDLHLHPRSNPKNFIDLTTTDSLEQMQSQIRAKIKELGTGNWVIGSGWNEFNFPKPEQHPPTRQDIDKAAPDNPVVLTRSGGHSCAANSMALRLAGITKDTPQPDHGFINHEPDGSPSGVIRERCDLVEKLVPRESEAELRPTWVQGLKDLLAMGITSVSDAMTPIQPGRGSLSFYELESIYHQYGDELPRMTMYISYPGAAALKKFTAEVGKTGYGDDRLRIGPIGETVIDGGFTGPTAWMLEPYKNQPGFYGKARYTPEQVRDMIDTGAQLGWQFNIHAIGDAAEQELVADYDEALHAYPKAVGKDPRWILTHFEVMPPPATMELIERDHIDILQQPNFIYNLGPRYEEILQPEQLAHVVPIRTLLQDGIRMAFSSDDMPIGPMIGLYGAVTHRSIDGNVLAGYEKVSMAEALRLYTRDGAYMTFEEGKKGAIMPGMLADMIVLHENPLTVSPAQIMSMKVDMTMVGGRILYTRPGAAD